MSFKEAWSSRVEVVADGVSVPFLRFDNLLVNKRSAGRAKDLDDVRALERLQQARRTLKR